MNPNPYKTFLDNTFAIKKIKPIVPRSMRKQYTDILTHVYEPNGGHNMAIGSCFGDLIIVMVQPRPMPIMKGKAELNRSNTTLVNSDPSSENNSSISPDFLDPSGNKPNEIFLPELPTDHLSIVSKRRIPSKEAILGLHWGPAGIYVGSRSAFYLYNWNPHLWLLSRKPVVRINCPFDILDICGVPTCPDKLVLACDDFKTRVYDMKTEKLILDLAHHTGLVEVCTSSEEHIATGAQDGLVQLYDSHYRTKAPIKTFQHGQTAINNVAMNKFSTSIAVVGHGFDAPQIHNVRSGKLTQPFQQTNKPSRVYALTFDRTGQLYWGGEGGVVYRSDGLDRITSEFQASYGGENISSIYSIATSMTSYGGIRFSAAGTGNGVIMSENAKYWTTHFRI